MNGETLLACTAGEGLGNTVLLVREADAARTGVEPGALARRLCGEYWDGLLLLGTQDGGARPARILNRDGSDGGVCLNGLRVAALWEGGNAGEFAMAGRRVPWRRVDGGVELHLRRSELAEQMTLRAVPLEGLRGIAVPFWNPHCVVPVRALRDLNLRALWFQVCLRKDLFPDGANVEAVTEAGPGRLRMRVWERGVGETKACGSGAVAVAIAAWAGGARGPLEIAMPGGSVRLDRAPDGGILLRGGASLGEPMQLAVD